MMMMMMMMMMMCGGLYIFQLLPTASNDFYWWQLFDAHSLNFVGLGCTSDFCSFVNKEKSFLSKIVPIDTDFFPQKCNFDNI